VKLSLSLHLPDRLGHLIGLRLFIPKATLPPAFTQRDDVIQAFAASRNRVNFQPQNATHFFHDMSFILSPSHSVLIEPSQ
jgi:hypothetical protein